MFEVSYVDILFSVVLILVFYFSAKSKSWKLSSNYSSFYSKGILVKFLGAFFFCTIYAFYYGGGDTINYYKGVDAMYSLFWNNPIDYFTILFGDNDAQNRALFWKVGKFPPSYMYKDDRTFNVIKFSSILSIPVFGGFFSTSILLARVTYSWVWRLFSFVCVRYKGLGLERYFAFGILYLPSCVFWGSGIMKDTFTFSATCFFVVGLNEVLVNKRKIARNLIQLIIAFYLLITIKSYILFALLPGALIYFNFERLKSIKNPFARFILLPVLLLISGGIVQFLFVDMDDMFGRYSSDRLLEEAVIQQQDLQRSVYGDNNFDIGTFEPTWSSVASKAHLAINAALFRPYIWESGSPVMYLSGLENSIILIVSIYLFLFKGLGNIPKIFSDGFLIFCLLFTILLAFGVGLSTSNFGALVRYKIPFMPFFLTLIVVLGFKKREGAN